MRGEETWTLRFATTATPKSLCPSFRLNDTLDGGILNKFCIKSPYWEQPPCIYKILYASDKQVLVGSLVGWLVFIGWRVLISFQILVSPVNISSLYEEMNTVTIFQETEIS
jgi:hypothetical protein